MKGLDAIEDNSLRLVHEYQMLSADNDEETAIEVTRDYRAGKIYRSSKMSIPAMVEKIETTSHNRNIKILRKYRGKKV